MGYSVLYAFSGGADGGYPNSNLIFDAAGNLYGTAFVSGVNGGPGGGVVFELTPPAQGQGEWTETVLYTFTGSTDGAQPTGGLIFDTAGNLYGTTEYGGQFTGCPYHDFYAGCGTVFRLSPPAKGKTAWTETVLYRFPGGSKGVYPYYSGVAFDKAGNLYGATYFGGNVNLCTGGNTYTGCGVVYELSPRSHPKLEWKEAILHVFTNSPDGAYPDSGVILDSTGNVYGGTQSGGVGSSGVVFKLVPPTGGQTKWANTNYSFTGGFNGGGVWAPLVFDAVGNLIGSTYGGGQGGGVVFSLTPATGTGSNWVETVLHSFTNGSDGGNLVNGDAISFDPSGNLYGTSYYFGTYGSGNVFRITP